MAVMPREMTVVVHVDTSRFEAAIQRVLDAWNALPPRVRHAVLTMAHPDARHRSRLVTRRKQRRSW